MICVLPPAAVLSLWNNPPGSSFHSWAVFALLKHPKALALRRRGTECQRLVASSRRNWPVAVTAACLQQAQRDPTALLLLSPHHLIAVIAHLHLRTVTGGVLADDFLKPGDG